MDGQQEHIGLAEFPAQGSAKLMNVSFGTTSVTERKRCKKEYSDATRSRQQPISPIPFQVRPQLETTPSDRDRQRITHRDTGGNRCFSL